MYETWSFVLALRTGNAVCIDTHLVETKSIEVLVDVFGYGERGDFAVAG